MKIGDVFADKFKIVGTLGSGGNGDVYKAIILNDNSEVALKILRKPNKYATEVEVKKFNKKLKRFNDEVKIVQQYQNDMKGIIPILEASISECESSECWYTMPIAIPISKHMKEQSTKREETIIECIYSLSELLIKLHDLEIVHRDIKPNNIYFFDDNFCLGDFGLVDYPEKEELTSTGESVGAKNTMAPEFKADGKRADGKLGDVYSIAKTLWLMLMERNNGFDGQYNPFDDDIKLYKNTKLIHTVELDELLRQCTESNPTKRPSMREFHEGITLWKSVSVDVEKSNQSQWESIQKRIFGDYSPSSMEWDDIDSIIKILNLLKYYPSLNHMFCPNSGGIDLEDVKKAGECGFVYLYGNMVLEIVKPKRLVYVSFKGDFKWSYFFLELEEVESILSEPNVFGYEHLTEIKPGEYGNWILGNYGHYEDGTPLPKGYKVADRYLRGNFVLFSKSSVYNRISSTYDGRHNKLGMEKFKQHISVLHSMYIELREKYGATENFDDTFAKVIEEIERKRRIEAKTEEREEQKKSNAALKKLRDDFMIFLNTNTFQDEYHESLCLYNHSKSVIFYLFFYEENSVVFGKNRTFYILNEAFSFEKNEEDAWANIINRDKTTGLRFDNAEQIEHFVNLLKERFSSNYEESEEVIGGLFESTYDAMFEINMQRIEMPTHFFTKQEVVTLLRDGDDSKHNCLVINTEGYAELVASDSCKFITQYAVRCEGFCAFNNYVGKYTNLDNRDDDYLFCLKGWLAHLNRGSSKYVDYCEETEDVLLAQINNTMAELQKNLKT